MTINFPRIEILWSDVHFLLRDFFGVNFLGTYTVNLNSKEFEDFDCLSWGFNFLRKSLRSVWSTSTNVDSKNLPVLSLKTEISIEISLKIIQVIRSSSECIQERVFNSKSSTQSQSHNEKTLPQPNINARISEKTYKNENITQYE